MRFALITLLLTVLAAATLAQDAARPNETPDPDRPTLDHLASLTNLAVSGWQSHADLPHPEDTALDTSGWDSAKPGDRWTTGPRVFRCWIQIPEKVNGYSIQGSKAKLDLIFRSDETLTISVFNNGSIAFRGDEDMQQPIPLTDNAQPGQRFLIAVRLDASEVPTNFERAQLQFEPPSSRPDPAMLRTEMIATRPLIAAYENGKATREAALDAAIHAINFSALSQNDQTAFDNSLRDAQQKLQALDPWMKQFTVRAVGNSHIDMAWLWPWTETVEVVRNTFQSVLDLMREYPDFKFTMSSARTYEWVQEKYPELFSQIQQRVKEGRWEVIGGMWVEPDLNMPAGESLVRQILVGKEYFQQNFGADINIGWNPDSFGYNWQLPQIYKKSGIDYFVTSKLLWATDYTKFPYRLFWWEAPDGSRLLSYFPHEYDNDFEVQRMTQDLSLYAPLIYGQDTASHPQMLYLFGVGDHGGGPTRTMLDRADQLRSSAIVFPKIEFSTAGSFFADLEKQLPNLQVPTWKNELYFQYHRGVYTTQSETKRRIRRDEDLMLDAEKYASIASFFGRTYPQADLTLAWKNLLFDHFHDIMPGSGIAVNYLDAKRNLEDVARAASQTLNSSLREIAAHINTQGPGVPVVIFNSLSWSRSEVVPLDVQLPAPATQVEVVDSTGKPAKSELLSIDRDTHRAHLLVLASVPAMGYQTYFVRAAAKNQKTTPMVQASATSLENSAVRLKIDPTTGCLVSLFDKRSSTELLAPSETDSGGPTNATCGNLLQAFYDKPKRWDAWNIDADFEKQHWDLTTPDTVTLLESGPLHAVIRIKNHFQNSTFVRDITMYADSPRIDVKMQADWNEKHILLKVGFPLAVHSSQATFEIPYGSIERPTTRNTPAEQAMFEVPAQRWADLSDTHHGFSLLNDSKYGYDAKGNVLRLSLLRSPAWPDPHADEGHHEFTYSMYAHPDTWREAFTVRQGYSLNDKLTPMPTMSHQGSLPPEHSFVNPESPNVVLTAMKNAESGDGVVLRYYEWRGNESDVKLQLPAGVQSVSEVNLMEKPVASLTLTNGSVILHTKPYEIKTLKVKFAPTPSQSQN